MAAPELLPPRFHRGRHSRTSLEKWAWVFMRVSGALLVVIILTHLVTNLVLGDGIDQVDFAFVAGKWAQPLWQWWAVAMLWLAMIHGSNGMRTLINDYARDPRWRATLKIALLVACVATIALGTYVAFGYDPCPAGLARGDLPGFCPGAGG